MLRKLIKTIWIARRSLLQHKLRSFLSVLGVVCGVMAVLSMISIGEGARQKLLIQIEQLGTRNIFVKSVAQTQEQRAKARENLSPGLTPADMDRIDLGCSSVSGIGALEEISAAVMDIPREISPQIVGVSSNFASLQNFRLARGRFISDLDVERKNLVCVLGDQIALALGASGKIGNTIRIENSLFTITGIISRFNRDEESTSAIPVRNYNEMIFIPLGTKPAVPLSANQNPRITRDELTELVIQVQRTGLVMETATSIERIIQVAHNDVRDYQLVVPQELLNQAQKTQRTFNIVLGTIAGISLLVGGIGIMNIMLASVSERTREIGLRRAVGATKGDIVVQFIVESVALTLSGGLVGVCFGGVAVYFISRLAGWHPLVTGWAVFLPLVMSIMVGIFFGLYPAYQAAKMNPITALRFE